MRNVLVSACLLGLATRYDGTHKENSEVIRFLKQNDLNPIPVCPEQLGGFSTPRPKCQFIQGDGEDVLKGTGRLHNDRGEDVTARFLKGAEQTLKIAQTCAAEIAVLQQRSPSCGFGTVYLKNRLIDGSGVTAALLSRHDLTIFADGDLPREKI